MLIQLFLNQQEQLEKVSDDLHSLDTKMQAMMEQLILANKNRFGRSSVNFIAMAGTPFLNESIVPDLYVFCHLAPVFLSA